MLSQLVTAPEAKRTPHAPLASDAHRPDPPNIHLGIDTVGPWVEGSADPLTGRYASLELHSTRYHLALSAAGIDDFNGLVDQSSSHEQLQDYCDRAYTQARLIEWLHLCQGESAQPPWALFLVARLANDVKFRKVLIPLQGIRIGAPFSIGLVHFDYFTALYFEQLFTRMRQHGRTEEEVSVVRNRYGAYLGRVYASYECIAEHGRARQRALDSVERAVALLRFFHPAATDVRVHCSLGREGAVTPNRERYFFDEDGAIAHEHQQTTRWDEDFALSVPRLESLFAAGMSVVDGLMRSPQTPPGLHTDILEAMALYSAGLTFDTAELRLLHALVAVESVLLRNKTEPITGNLARRVALLAGATLDERRSIVKDLREAYDMRSGFVHHGEALGSRGVDRVNRTMRHCWFAIARLLTQTRWSARMEAIDDLDDSALQVVVPLTEGG